MPEVTDHLDELDGQPVFWRSAPPPAGTDGEPPVLYLHDAPTSSDDWVSLLARTGGLAPDLPGFGRSGKRGDRDYSLRGLGAFVERFLALVGAERVRLVAHGWGAAGLVWAQQAPDRVARIVLIDALPLLDGFRWPPVARAIRARGLGELLVGATTRRLLRRGIPPELADAAWAHFDQGTQRALLALHRATPESALGAAGAGLDDVDCPALVVWGERDPYVPARFATAYAAHLGDGTTARALLVPDAGHWPWCGRPEVADAIVRFLDA